MNSYKMFLFAFIAVFSFSTSEANNNLNSIQLLKGNEIIDTHAHIRLGESDVMSPNHTQGTTELLKLQLKAGIQRTALIVMNASGNMTETRTKNDKVIAAVRQHPQHFYAVASVHPADGIDALNELERLAKLGVKQIKLHPNSQELNVDSAEVAAVTNKCGELGMVVLFDSYNPLDPTQLGKLLMLTLRQPNTKFVLAHAGFSEFRQIAVYAMLRNSGQGAKNVWFDLSATAVFYSDSPIEEELVWTMRKIGMDRFLFGSDWPTHDSASALRALHSLSLSQNELEMITSTNAKELFKL